MSSFTVRPAGTDKGPFRIRLTAVSMLALKLKSGDICEIRTGADASVNGNPNGNGNSKSKLAIAWEGGGPGMKDSIVQTSKLLQDCYGFKLGDRITITRFSRAVDAGVVSVRKLGAPLDDLEISFWTQKLASTIPPAGDYLVTSQTIRARDDVEFVVKDIGVHDIMMARVTPSTTFRIINNGSPEDARSIVFKPAHLAGISKETDAVQKLIDQIMRAFETQNWPLCSPAQGVLLYGNRGTGKSTFIEALSRAGWTSVSKWKPGTEYVPPTEPCLIIVPSKYLLSNATTPSYVEELESLFQRIIGSPALVIGEAPHPNDIHDHLRSEVRFAEEIELPIPSAPQRKEILLALRGTECYPTNEQIQELSERTHGCVGADLRRLVRLLRREEKSIPATCGEKDGQSQADAVEEALRLVRPSALKEIFLEKPNVKWSDIGGHHAIKRQLQDAIERPLKHADRMKLYGMKPKKGVLLYGPPGCSKTLLVRALATEAGLNFLAVKGAELISMYVGESERATRDVFRKARAASPSIIFFDEIDAIASRGRAGSELNVLTTLLNEMDGFEELRNVFVVAATNKPQHIDPALMRPGRFDSIVYIGPPDLDTRKEIFQKRLSQMCYEPGNGSEEEAITKYAAMTEGFSGAEVAAICETAGELAFDNIDVEHVSDEHVEDAIRNTPKSITPEVLEEFESWNAARMAR